MKKEGLFTRGAEAVKTVCWTMEEVRVRGTALYGLTSLATSGGRAGRLGQDAIVILGKGDSNVVPWLNKEQLKILQTHNKETSEEEKERQHAILESIIKAIGPSSGKNGRKTRKRITAEEEFDPEKLMRAPQKMRGNGENHVKPTKPMRPVPSKKKPGQTSADLNNELMISRGPVVDKIFGSRARKSKG